MAHKLTRDHATVLAPHIIEYYNEIKKERLEDWKKTITQSLANSTKQAVDILIPVVGLLMVLEESYSPLVTGQFSGDLDSWERWKLRRKRKEIAPQILTTIGMTTEKVKEAYGYVADFGHLYLVVTPSSSSLTFDL